MNNSKVGDLLELVGLSSRTDEALDRLSTGMGQRLSLATALLGEPEILLLDEPFTGLDPVAQKALKQLTRELADRGTTILISSHLLNELESLVDRVILLHHGQVVIEGEVRAIKRNLKLDKILLLKGEKGDPLPLISEKVINSSINGNWSISVENEDGWSRKRLTELVQRLSDNGCIPYHVEVKTADLSDILEATTGIGGMDLSEHAMVPLSKMEVEEE
jgi:ABC-type multidrug transport system ATPase subunit